VDAVRAGLPEVAGEIASAEHSTLNRVIERA
jgi:hypothetical protein